MLNYYTLFIHIKWSIEVDLLNYPWSLVRVDRWQIVTIVTISWCLDHRVNWFLFFLPSTNMECNIFVLVNVHWQVPTGKQLLSELVHTTILKDFAEAFMFGLLYVIQIWQLWPHCSLQRTERTERTDFKYKKDSSALLGLLLNSAIRSVSLIMLKLWASWFKLMRCIVQIKIRLSSPQFYPIISYFSTYSRVQNTINKLPTFLTVIFGLPVCMLFAFPLSTSILDTSKSRLYRKAGL